MKNQNRSHSLDSRNTFLTAGRYAGILLIIFLIWRIALFALGANADYFLPYRPSFIGHAALTEVFHLPRWFASWANFDGFHYITVAQEGYGNFGLIQAFFPMYPYLLLRPLFLLANHKLNLLLAGVILSNIAAVTALWAWFGFLRQDLGERKAWWGVVLFLSFPTALFWGALYTESLFFTAIICAFWAARSRRWGLATVFAIVASATRIVGVFIVPALLVELWLQWNEQQPNARKIEQYLSTKILITDIKNFISQHWKTCILLLFGSLGLLGYMAYLQYRFNDPLFFLHVQKAFGAGRESSMTLYPKVVWRSIKILVTMRPFDWRYYTAILEFLAGTFGFLGIIAGFKKVRSSYLLFGLGAFLLPPLTGTFSSMPRYLLICFPLYIFLIEVLDEYKWVKFILLPLFWISLFINVILFIQGFWVS